MIRINQNELNIRTHFSLLCHHLKAHHFTDKDGDKYCDEV